MSPLLEGDPTPIKDRAIEIISELYHGADDMDAMCTAWPCEKVQVMAYRIAELEYECSKLKASQCRCDTKSHTDTDATGN